MNTFRFFAVALFLTALLSVSAFAQGAPQSAAGGKIVYVNVTAFDDDKGGITKYVTVMNALDKEFQPVNTQIQSMATRYQSLGTEIQNLQKAATNVNVPASNTQLQSKMDEYGKLERDIKFQQEDAKAKFQSRYQVVVAPVMQDIMKSLQDFAKQRGYSMILDAAKLDQAGIILAVGNDSADVTKDFIAFYNGRSGGATTGAAAPR